MANNPSVGGMLAANGARSAPRPAPRQATSLAAAILGAAIWGCQSPPPDVAPAQTIGAALDLADGIVFRSEGGPIDEPFDTTTSLTLAEAMRRAVTTDPSIQAALARVRIAFADAEQARAWPNPILNLALRWPESGGSPVIEASLAQDLIAILTSPRRSSAADNRLRGAAADAVVVALDVSSELHERYATAQTLDELVPLLQQRRELLTRLVDIAQARLDVGEGIREDLVVLQAQRVELEVTLAETEQERTDERIRLARQIGEPSNAATWTLEQWTPPVRVAASEGAWIEAALEHRPEIQSVAWRLAALGDDLALTSLLPLEGTSPGLDAEHDSGWSAGPAVSAPLPIFDTGAPRRHRVTAQQIEARHELTRTRRAVVEDVRRAFGALARSQQSLARVKDELIPLQHQRRELAEAAFRAGHSDATSLFLAEQDLRSAEARAIDLERRTTLALVRLHRAIGGYGVAARVATHTSPLPDARATRDAGGADPATISPGGSQEDH